MSIDQGLLQTRKVAHGLSDWSDDGGHPRQDWEGEDLCPADFSRPE